MLKNLHSKFLVVVYEKVLSESVPMFLINTLAVWYTNQKMYITWSMAYFPSFNVSNGVKQGGILSPVLCIVDMNGLSD